MFEIIKFTIKTSCKNLYIYKLTQFEFKDFGCFLQIILKPAKIKMFKSIKKGWNKNHETNRQSQRSKNSL